MSRETDALIQYLRDSTVPHRVTSVATGTHAPNSRHFQAGTGGKGLAVDFAGPRAGDDKAMRAIFDAFFETAEQLYELIYCGPRFCVKAGKKIDPVKVYGRKTLDAHRNHVHVSVERGTFVRWQGATGAPGVEVNRKEFPGGEDMLVRRDIQIPSLDDHGNGWVEVDVRPDQVVSMVVNGSYPPVDGYWNLPLLARQDRGGKTVVTITEGEPRGQLLFSIWAVA